MLVLETARSIVLTHYFIFFMFYNRTCPKTDPRFKPLVQRVTQNFDTFEDYGTNLNKEGKTRVVMNPLDQFYNYDYRRVRKPRVPLPMPDGA
jgi:hypothetical protein